MTITPKMKCILLSIIVFSLLLGCEANMDNSVYECNSIPVLLRHPKVRKSLFKNQLEKYDTIVFVDTTGFFKGCELIEMQQTSIVFLDTFPGKKLLNASYFSDINKTLIHTFEVNKVVNGIELKFIHSFTGHFGHVKFIVKQNRVKITDLKIGVM
jgi:hypothetical protein